MPTLPGGNRIQLDEEPDVREVIPFVPAPASSEVQLER